MTIAYLIADFKYIFNIGVEKDLVNYNSNVGAYVDYVLALLTMN